MRPKHTEKIRPRHLASDANWVHSFYVSKTIKVEKQGRRFYITGDTYPLRTQLRTAGCKWDPTKKAWWTGKASVAASFEDAIARPARWTRLDDGAWGVVVRDRPELGRDVTVTKRDGSTSTVEIAAILGQNEHGEWICSIPAQKQSQSPRRRTQTAPQRTSCRGCRGPIRDAPHHRAMDGYCGSCAFDEFDM